MVYGRYIDTENGLKNSTNKHHDLNRPGCGRTGGRVPRQRPWPERWWGRQISWTQTTAIFHGEHMAVCQNLVPL